jgi:O-antigen ligase
MKNAIYIIYILFVFSGILKVKSLAVLPFDPTVVFGILVMLYMLYRAIVSTEYPKAKLIQLLIVIPFILWLIITCTYTLSKEYYLDKLLRVPLLFIAFLFPIFFLKEESDFKRLRITMNLFAIGVIIGLLMVYIAGGNSMQLYFIGSDQKIVPDYLSLGEVLGIAVLMNLYRGDIFSWIVNLSALFFMTQLGGRGPFIILIAILLFHILKSFRLSYLNIILYPTLLLVLPFLYSSFKNSKHTELLVKRIESIGDKKDSSIGERKRFVDHSLKIMTEKPFLGVGFGGFGMSYFNDDVRSYPHNIILEITCELGIIGLLLFLPFLLVNSGYALAVYFSSPNNIYACFCLAFLYVFLQTMKSSSFIDIRPFFMTMGGTTAAYLMMQRQKPSTEVA